MRLAQQLLQQPSDVLLSGNAKDGLLAPLARRFTEVFFRIGEEPVYYENGEEKVYDQVRCSHSAQQTVDPWLLL